MWPKVSGSRNNGSTDPFKEDNKETMKKREQKERTEKTLKVKKSITSNFLLGGIKNRKIEKQDEWLSKESGIRIEKTTGKKFKSLTRDKKKKKEPVLHNQKNSLIISYGNTYRRWSWSNTDRWDYNQTKQNEARGRKYHFLKKFTNY